MAGGGIYRPEPQILLAIRRHIAAKPALLTRALARPAVRGKPTAGSPTRTRCRARPRASPPTCRTSTRSSSGTSSRSSRSTSRGTRRRTSPPTWPATSATSCRSWRWLRGAVAGATAMSAVLGTRPQRRTVRCSPTPRGPSTFDVAGGRRDRRGARDADRRRASADALRRQAGAAHADDAGRGARGARHRLPAQPAAASSAIDDIVSVQVDWDVERGRVKTRHGLADLEAKTAKRTKTTGCGQGTVFGDLMDEIDDVRLPAGATLSQLDALRAARPRAPARDDLQAGRRGARLRARDQRATAAPRS